MSLTLFAMLCRKCKESDLIYVGKKNGFSNFHCEKCGAKITFSSHYMKRFKPVTKSSDVKVELDLAESSLDDGSWSKPPKHCPDCGESLRGKIEPNTLTIECACGQVVEKRADGLWYVQEMSSK